MFKIRLNFGVIQNSLAIVERVPPTAIKLTNRFNLYESDQMSYVKA